jgi:N6-L-threonylcarbamoyladenine synthase
MLIIMNILGIETSCDETGASIVSNGVQILSNSLASSVLIQQKFGGVMPEHAAREQSRVIVPVIEEITKDPKNIIDAIGVTIGPGLIGSLLVGVETAKSLAYIWKRPIIPVNHLVGHIYGCWVQDDTKEKITQPKFPALVLLVSGGHTELILMEGHGKFKLISTTRDDAAGEAFDKTARLLGLPYPGGPSISKAATLITKKDPQIALPRPLLDSSSLDFSFSGLKTAVLYEVRKQKKVSEKFISQMAFEIQESITDVLIKKTFRAVGEFSPKSLLLCGGVAANKRLRKRFIEKIENYPNIKFFCPPIQYCTDNAATIASAAFFNYSPIPWQEINANPSLEIV